MDGQQQGPGSGSAGPATEGERSLTDLDRRAFVRRMLGTGALVSAAMGCPLLRSPTVAAAAPAAGSTTAAATPPGLACHGAELRGITFPRQARGQEGRFGFMFPSLPPFEPPDELLVALAATMEEPGAAGPPATDNPRIPAGFTFLSQFVDHDITFDTTPLEEQQADPNANRNFRSPRLDLDSVYGRGPAGSPQLYDQADPDRLAVIRRGGVYDVPRDPAGRALFADPRDDQNLVITQIHLAMRRFHNALVDHVRDQAVAPSAVFEEARRLTRWHYQWVVLHDLLPRLVGEEVMEDLVGAGARGRPSPRLTSYRPRNRVKPMMPVEFAGAAYRFGHSMVRPGYQLNDRSGALFLGEQAADGNLNGSRPIPAHLVIDWRHFYDLPGRPPPQRARRIDTDLSFPLFRLPSTVIPPPDERLSLAERNLIRGKRLGLPSGQAVAREMGLAPLSNDDLGLGGERGWSAQAPLWFYVLKEAELHHQGERLGPVGGRIVGEVLIGLCRFDPTSHLAAAPAFRPSPPIAPADGIFAMGDLLMFAGAA